MLGQGLDQAQETAFGIIPSVHREFLLIRFQTLDDSSNTEFEIAFGTIERTDHEIHDTEMVDRLVWVLEGLFLFFTFQSAHDFFGFFILIDHDIAHTEIGDHNSSQ